MRLSKKLNSRKYLITFFHHLQNNKNILASLQNINFQIKLQFWNTLKLLYSYHAAQRKIKIICYYHFSSCNKKMFDNLTEAITP